jgi:hypothetical protein
MQQSNRCNAKDIRLSQYSQAPFREIRVYYSAPSETKYLSIVEGRYTVENLIRLINRAGWKAIEISED